jgi:hypothetical protein
MSYVHVYDARVMPDAASFKQQAAIFRRKGYEEQIASLPLLEKESAPRLFSAFVHRLAKSGHREFTVFFPSGFGCSIDAELSQYYEGREIIFRVHDSSSTLKDTSPSPKKKKEPKASRSDKSSSTPPSSSSSTKVTPVPEKKKEVEKKVKKVKKPIEKKYPEEEYVEIKRTIREQTAAYDPEWNESLLRLYLEISQKEFLVAAIARITKEVPEKRMEVMEAMLLETGVEVTEKKNVETFVRAVVNAKSNAKFNRRMCWVEKKKTQVSPDEEVKTVLVDTLDTPESNFSPTPALPAAASVPVEFSF